MADSDKKQRRDDHLVSPVSIPRTRSIMTREAIIDAADQCIANCVKLGRPYIKKSDLMEPTTSEIILHVIEVNH